MKYVLCNDKTAFLTNHSIPKIVQVEDDESVMRI